MTRPVVLARPVAALGFLAVAAAPLCVPARPAPQPVTAAVSLAGAAPVLADGVALLAHLPGVGAEVVRGTPGALRRLAVAPGVLGLRRDGALRAQSAGVSFEGTGVYAAAGLAAPAGAADAGAGVTVAVVDTGVSDTSALDRASGRLVDGVDTSPVLDGGEPVVGGPHSDGYGHGTFLAGIVAGGVPAGGTRPLGVAPAARVVDVKVADDTGRTSLVAVLAGLDWVASHRPIDVVTLALAATRPGDGYGADPLTLAVAHVRAKGTLVVAAAGNTPGEVGDPGFAPRALTVGAADLTAGAPEVAEFSGSAVVAGVAKPDVVASGVRVLGLLAAGSVLAPAPTETLARGSGTSEAAAVAAGAAAAYLGAHPAAGAVELKRAVRGGAAPVDDPRAGAGVLRGFDPSAASGEEDFDSATFWTQDWAVDGWVDALRAAWSDGSWPVGAPWPTDQWSADSWSAKSWSAKSWSAKSWSAKSWSAQTWELGP